MSDFIELEYKYKADDVKLDDFVKLMESLGPSKRLDISSWDYYYTKGPDEFIRFRKSSDNPELTIKRKVKTSNNWERVEVDIPVDSKRVTDSGVAKFMELLDYKINFKIYKSCFIFWLDNVNYVYYIVYDENMKERGRYVEVEVNKERVYYLNSSDNKFTGGKTAEETLKEAAKSLETIGLIPQNRMKKSLFELFVRS